MTSFRGKPGYSAAHFRRLANGGPDTEVAIRDRRIMAEAGQMAVAEREERFPILTAENAHEAMRFQEERIAFHRNRLGIS